MKTAILKSIAVNYAVIGATVAVISAVVLAKDGKDSPSEIASYATVNGLLWPASLVMAAKKKQELKLARVEK